MDSTILQFLGGGAFAYVVIKEVLSFLKNKNGGRGFIPSPLPPLPPGRGEIQMNSEIVLVLREIKESNLRNGEKLESINRNMLVMLERQMNVNKVVDEIRNSH